MNAVVVDEDLFRRTVAFVRTMEGTCRACNYAKVHCKDCDLVHVRDLLSCLVRTQPARRMSEDAHVRRLVELLSSIRDADRPVTAIEVVLPEYCAKWVKSKSIRQLCEHGLVAKEVGDNGIARFWIPDDKQAVVDEIIERGELNF